MFSHCTYFVLNLLESIQQMETVLVQNKFFYKQTTGGRVRMNKIMVLIGNRDGLFGYSFKRVPWGAASTGIRQVVNRSGYRLCYFDRLEERTIYHNFFSRYGHCTVFATQKPPGTVYILMYEKQKRARIRIS